MDEKETICQIRLFISGLCEVEFSVEIGCHKVAVCHRMLFLLVLSVYFLTQLHHFPYPTLFPSCLSLYDPSFMLYHTHEQTTRTHFDCTTGHRSTGSTGLPTSQNSPVLP